MKLSKLDSFYRRQAPIYNLTRQTILYNHREAVQALQLQPADVVYDVACGTGKNIPHLLKKVKADQIHGFDYSHALLAQARKTYPDIHRHHADVTKPFADHKANKIICSYSLSMIHDREKALKIMIDTLHPGGKLVILDFNTHWKPWWRGKILQAFLRRCDINLDQDLLQSCKNISGITYHHQLYHDGYNTIVTIDKHA